MNKLTFSYECLWKAFVRPPRDEYDLGELGPLRFRVGRSTYQRTDIDITMESGKVLKCSHFEPREKKRPTRKMPCVIYLHGNCSSRAESISAVTALLPKGITVFAFDFLGCGHSEGEYISLGHHEVAQVKRVIDYLKQTNRVSRLGLWGRSMGASTALLYASTDSDIEALILDSPFSNLKELAFEVAGQFLKLPKMISTVGLSVVRKTIIKKVDFDIYGVNPIENLETSFAPAFFLTGENDTFVPPHHTQKLYDAYPGEKHLIFVDGDHNSYRPDSFYDQAADFFKLHLLNDFLVDEETHNASTIKALEVNSNNEALLSALEG